MANKVLETTVLSVEVQSGADKDGNATYTKKKIGNLLPDVEPAKAMVVADKVAELLDKNTRFIYVTEVSQIEE